MKKGGKIKIMKLTGALVSFSNSIFDLITTCTIGFVTIICVGGWATYQLLRIVFWPIIFWRGYDYTLGRPAIAICVWLARLAGAVLAIHICVGFYQKIIGVQTFIWTKEGVFLCLGLYLALSAIVIWLTFKYPR